MENNKLNTLVTKAKAGDQDAMNELIQASYQDMYYYALKITKKEDLAADATQDSCVEIIQTLGNLKESAAFVVWCRRIVYHQCTKRIGKSRIVALDENEDGETILDRIPDEAPGSLPEEVMENKDLRRIMLEMIDQLPESQRSALMLYYYERLSVKQIAEIQDENESTVKSRLFHGRKAVQKQVEDYEKKNGIKLHSIGILPLLYFLFLAGKAESDAAAAALLPKTMAAIAPAASAAAGTAAGAASGVAVATTASTSFFSTLAFKITAGAVAAALAIGGVVGGIAVGSQLLDSSETEEPSPSVSVPSVPLQDPGHTHADATWDCDNDAHWGVCECGAVSDNRQPHTFEGGECTVCHMPEPLPSFQLTLDCTQLSGQWTNMSNGYQENPVPEFHVNTDGSILIQGVTFYPVGNTPIENGLDHGDVVAVYYGTTPYDPEVGITNEEIFSSPIELLVSKPNGKIECSLSAISTELYGTRILGDFYRESDYSDYEKVALTVDNFYEYYEITVEEPTFGYTSHNAILSAEQNVKFTLKDGLGAPSWCAIEGDLQIRYCDVTYDSNNYTYEITDKGSLFTNPLSVQFFGSSERERVMETSGSYIGSGGVADWFGKLAEGYTVSAVQGYVFVPKQ